jgi:hypothetical protein
MQPQRPRLSRHLTTAVLAAVCLTPLAMPATAQQDDAPVAAPDESLVVRDVVVWVSDAFGGKLNRRSLFESTLPGFARTRRPARSTPDHTMPTPIGVVTFQGESGAVVDVLLEIDRGEFLGGWPKTRGRKQRLLWRDIELTDQPDSPPALPGGHWLTTLREAPRLAVKSGRHGDRFLLYDAELDHPNDLKITSTDRGYAVIYFGNSAVHDVTLYKPVEGGWRTGSVDTIQGKDKKDQPDGTAGQPDAVAATQPEVHAVAATQPDTDGAKAGGADDTPSKHFTLKGQSKHDGTYTLSITIEQIRPKPRLSVREYTSDESNDRIAQELNSKLNDFTYDPPSDPANPQDAYTQVAGFLVETVGEDGPVELIWDHLDEAPQWNDADGVTAAVPMSDQTLDKDAVLSWWKTRLTGLGLGESEVRHTLAILKASALDDTQMTAVYRLDLAELDRMLPLEVTPEPSRVIRVALVILTHADPDLAGQVDSLIAQLGDLSWARREEAHKQLLQIGPGAKKSLEAALENEDIEIVYRAEQLLEAINNPAVAR